MPTPVSWIARCALGLEDLVARELRGLGGGIGRTRPAPGSVRFEGPADAGMRANLRLRCADRILRVVGEGEASRFDALSALVFSLPWERHLDRRLPVDIAVHGKQGHLWHSGAVREAAANALASWGLAVLDGEGEGAHSTVDLSSERDRWTVAVDTTGVRLSRRGYRKDGGRAPLREDLAAAALMALGWTPDTPLLDPQCGSGTIVVEAALIADGRPPGGRRHFALERLADFDAARWEELRATRGERVEASIEGADRAGVAIKTARENLGRAGLQGRVHLHKRDIEQTPEAFGAGLVLTNPPWGRRLAVPQTAEQWAAWGTLLRERRPTWRRAVLAPHGDLADAFGAPRRLWLARHGGISIGLYTG